MKPNNTDPFWTTDISVLYRDNKLFDIYPGNHHRSIEEQYNAFTRLVLIYGTLVSLYKGKSEYMMWAIVVCLFVSVFVNHKKKVLRSHQQQEDVHVDLKLFKRPATCRRRTVDNPYGNLIFTNEENHLDACDDDYDDTEFDMDLPLDEWDVFGKNGYQRHFYRQPNVNIVNDQTEYAKWLYGKD